MTKTPDFFVNCYGDEESLKSKKQITGMFSVKITCEESIDSALNNGNSVSEIVEIGTNNGAYFKGLIHLNLDKILLMKEVNYKSGGGHIIIYEVLAKKGSSIFWERP